MTQQLGSNTFGTAKWIVSPTASNGTHTTIGSAITSASSGDTIFIRPGTYTENITLKAGVNLSAYVCDSFSGQFNFSGQVTISGKCSFSSAGTVSISGIALQTNGDYALEVSGSAASVIQLTHCLVRNTDNTAINYTSSSATSGITLNDCQTAVGATNTLYTSTSPGNITFFFCALSNSSTVSSTMTAGSMQMFNCHSTQPMSFSNAVPFIFLNTGLRTFGINTTAITTANTSGGVISNCYIQTGTASALSIGGSGPTTIVNSTINSSNTNAITGAGALEYSGLEFSGTSSTINTTTQTVLNSGPRVKLGSGVAGTGGCQMMSGTLSPNAVVTAPKGSLFLRTDGSGVNDRAYINTDGATAWTAIVTVA